MLKKGLSFLFVLVMLMSMFSVLPLSASAQETEIAEESADIQIADEGADTDIAEDGYSWGVELKNSTTMYVGETKQIDGVYTYNSIKSVEVSGDTGGGAISYQRSGKGAFIRALKPGTGKVKIAITSEYYGPNYVYDSKYDTVEWTITVKDRDSSSSLDTPSITGFDSLDSGVKITWGAVSGAQKYRVYYKGSNGWTKLGDTTSTSFVDTAVSSGSSKTYTVRCINAAGTAFTSSYNSNGWKYTYNMASPKITSMSSSSSGVKITWGKVTNATKYRVYYKGSNGWTKLADVTGTSYTHSAAKYGSTYTYTVRCINSAANRFTSSYNSTGWKHTHYLSTPSVTGLSSTANGIKITWGAVSGAAKYRVYYKGSNGWTKLADVTGTSYTHTAAKRGTSYTYTVRCINAAGNTFTSSYNSTGWKHTYNILSTPSITGFSSTADGVKITWGAVSGAEKYRVYYKGSNGWTKMGETTGTTFLDKNVRAGKTYRYTVRCINSSLTQFTSDYNSTGWTYTYNPKLATPKITSCETVSNGIKITWGAVPGATRYAVYYKDIDGAWVRMAETTSTSYLDTDVEYGYLYIYTVRCLTTNGKDFASSYDSEGTIAAYISTPKLTNAYMSGNNLYVSISDTHTADTYSIWVLSDSEYKYVGEIYSKSGWIYNVGDMLKAGKSYTFTVVGYDSSDDICTLPDLDGFTFRV